MFIILLFFSVFSSHDISYGFPESNRKQSDYPGVTWINLSLSLSFLYNSLNLMLSINFLCCGHQNDWTAMHEHLWSLNNFMHFTSAKIFQIPQDAALKLLNAARPSESNAFRVDFRSTHVHYLNNLEEDAMYRRWRSNINEVVFYTMVFDVYIFFQCTWINESSLFSSSSPLT